MIGRLSDLPQLARDHENLGIVVAIGDNWVRGRVVGDIRESFPEIQFVRAIHPSAQISTDARIGEGAVIMAGAVINPGASVGHFCIVNTRASLDHDSEMSDYSSLGPAATTGGGVRLGTYSNIGIGATVVQEIVIGEHTVIGAGAVVLHPVADRVVAYGVPARVMRPRAIGEKYLGEIHMTAGQTK